MNHDDMTHEFFYILSAKCKYAKMEVGIVWNINSVEMTVQNGDMGGCNFIF